MFRDKDIQREIDDDAEKIINNAESGDWKSFVELQIIAMEEGSSWNYYVLESVMNVLLEEKILLKRGKLGEEIFIVEIITLVDTSLNALSYLTCFPDLGFKKEADAESYFNEQLLARKGLKRNINLRIKKETIIKKSDS